MSYQLQKEYLTDFGKSYSGPAQEATIYFQTPGPDQIDGPVENWLKGNMIKDAINSVVKAGGKPIKIQVYRDKSPTWYTKYHVVITAQVPAGMGQATMAFPIFWVAVMGFLLALSWINNQSIKAVRDIIWKLGGSASFILIALGLLLAFYAFSQSNKRKTS